MSQTHHINVNIREAAASARSEFAAQGSLNADLRANLLGASLSAGENLSPTALAAQVALARKGLQQFHAGQAKAWALALANQEKLARSAAQATEDWAVRQGRMGAEALAGEANNERRLLRTGERAIDKEIKRVEKDEDRKHRKLSSQMESAEHDLLKQNYRNREVAGNDPANWSMMDRMTRSAYGNEWQDIISNHPEKNTPSQKAEFFRRRKGNLAQSMMFPAGMELGGMIGGQFGSMLGGSLGFRLADAVPNIAPALAGITAAIAASIGTVRLAGSNAQALSPFSGQIATAISYDQQRDIQSKLARGRESGGVYSAYTESTGNLSREFDKTVDQLLTILAPFLIGIMFDLELILKGINAVSEILAWPMRKLAEELSSSNGVGISARLDDALVPPDPNLDPKGFREDAFFGLNLMPNQVAGRNPELAGRPLGFENFKAAMDRFMGRR